jgi:hypothetical protein
MMELVKNVDGNEVLAHLTLNVPDYYCAASLAAVTCRVKVPMMGDFPFAHLA